MSNIPLKWIDFAKKYLALPEASKPVWLQKLSPKQQEYLKLILKELSDPAKKSVLTSKPAQNFDLKSRVSNENTTIGSNPASKSNLNHAQNPAQALNLSQAKFLTTNLAQNQNLNLKPNSTPSPVFNPQVAESQSFLMEFPNSQLQTSPYPQFSASADQSKPKTLNMSLIMPAQKFDLGIAAKSKKTLKQAKQLSVSANLSKQEYLKLKAGSMVKNTILQAFLVVLVLAVPIAGTISALNNSNSVKAIGSGQKSITQVLAEQNVGQVGVSDLDFKVWMADFKDLKDEDKTANSDPDQDGLTNLEEYSFKTTPANAHTCNNSKLDGENILAQIDPVTCKPVNFNDPSVAAKFDGVISRTKINYRLSMVALDKFLNSKAITAPDLPSKPNIPDLNIDYNQNATLEIKAADTAFKTDQKFEVSWMQSLDTNQLLDRVDKQIVAYPNKIVPGKTGNLYLSGKAQIKANSDGVISDGVDIFTKLDRLEPGDMLIFSLKTKEGQSKALWYKVQTQNLSLASDPKQFKTSRPGNSELTLATPWTTISPDQRLLVKATLDKVE